MGREGSLRLLRELLDSRMTGLRICNEALEHEAPEPLRSLMESLRDADAELISRLQKTIEAVMEEV